MVTDKPLLTRVSAIHPPRFAENAIVSQGRTHKSPDSVRLNFKTYDTILKGNCLRSIPFLKNCFYPKCQDLWQHQFLHFMKCQMSTLNIVTKRVRGDYSFSSNIIEHSNYKSHDSGNWTERKTHDKIAFAVSAQGLGQRVLSTKLA